MHYLPLVNVNNYKFTVINLVKDESYFMKTFSNGGKNLVILIFDGGRVINHIAIPWDSETLICENKGILTLPNNLGSLTKLQTLL